MPVYPERKCANPTCKEGSFIPTRKDKRYCSEECRKREEVKRYGKRNPAKKSKIAKDFNLADSEYSKITEKGCEVCGTKENLCIDHDHVTGKICGCLCRSCNLGLGNLKEDEELLKSALRYLKKTKKTSRVSP